MPPTNPKPNNAQPVGNILKGNAAINKAVGAHKNDEIKEGFQDLPGGITNGEAQVTMCKFGIYAQGTKHAGKPYFMAQASVTKPTHHGDMKIQGLFTKIGPEPICDTPENKISTSKTPRLTTDDHVAWVIQMLGRMGVDPSTLTDGASLETAAAHVQEAQPVIVFKTTTGKTQIDPKTGKPKVDPKTGKAFEPRIFHDWIKLADSQEGDTSDEGAGVADQGGGDEGDGGSDTAANAAGGDEETPDANPEGAGDAEVTDYSGEDDLDVLVAASDQDGENNGTAQDRMIELAVEAGIDKDAAEGAESWEALKTMIEEARAAAEAPAPEIKKGSSVRYTVTEGKPPKKKTIDATVLSVKDGKADIKRQDNKLVVKGVALDKLATA